MLRNIKQIEVHISLQLLHNKTDEFLNRIQSILNIIYIKSILFIGLHADVQAHPDKAKVL